LPWNREKPSRRVELAFTPDGNNLLAAQWDAPKIHVWNVATGKPRFVLERPNNAAYRLGLTPKGELLATGTNDGHIPLWDLNTGEVVRTLKTERPFSFPTGFSADGKTLVTLEQDELGKRRIGLWDVASATRVRIFDQKSVWSNAAIFSLDGKSLITATDGGVIRLWDAAPGE